MNKPYGSIDPNSSHQIWSRWTFHVHTSKIIAYDELKINIARWLRAGFGSVGRAKIELPSYGIKIIAEVEGVPAHDPGYIKSVKLQFKKFVEKGWGQFSYGVVDVKILAGDLQDGKPNKQLIVMPQVPLL